MRIFVASHTFVRKRERERHPLASKCVRGIFFALNVRVGGHVERESETENEREADSYFVM